MAKRTSNGDRRTTIRTRTLQDQVFVELIEPVDTRHDLVPLEPGATRTWDDLDEIDEALDEVGNEVYRSLCHHEAVRDRLTELQELPKPVEPRPPHRLEFEVVGSPEPTVMWEALWAEDAEVPFAFDPRWEILRTAPVDQPPTDAVAVAKRIRWTGVIAATGPAGLVNEIREEVLAAIKPMDDAKLPVDVTLVVATSEFGQEVATDLATLTHVNVVKVLPVPSKREELQATVLGEPKQGPHIVHLYGHGRPTAKGSVLHFATKEDIRSKAPTSAGSAVIAPKLLVGGGPWRNDDLLLVVLNACKSAIAPADFPGGSPALQLVRDEFVPYVIANHRVVTAADAHATTRCAYESMIPMLGALVGKVGDQGYIPSLRTARTSFCDVKGKDLDEAAESDPRWLIPGLWTRDTQVGIGSGKEIARRIEHRLLGEVADAARPTAPPKLIDEIETQQQVAARDIARTRAEANARRAVDALRTRRPWARVVPTSVRKVLRPRTKPAVVTPAEVDAYLDEVTQAMNLIDRAREAEQGAQPTSTTAFLDAVRLGYVPTHPIGELVPEVDHESQNEAEAARAPEATA